MKKPLIVLVLLFVASPSVAQINLAWRNCITVTSGTNSARINQNSACDGTGGPFSAVVSFIAPPNVTNFIGATAVLEMWAPWPTVPDYWRHGIGECRETSFSAGFTSGFGTGATGACQDPYDGATTIREWLASSEVPCIDRATFTVQLTRDTGRPLTAGQQYVANTVTFDTNHAIDCTGCQVPAFLVVRRVEIHQASPAPTIALVDNALRNFIYWQGGPPEGDGGGVCGQPVPTRSHTWGAIKATYR